MRLWLQIYESLEPAYAALAERLNSSDGNYMFGANPSSLDALLFGHLAFHAAAPVSCPEIQHQVRLKSELGMEYSAWDFRITAQSEFFCI